MDKSAWERDTRGREATSREVGPLDDVPIRTGWQPPAFGAKRRAFVPRWVPISLIAGIVVVAGIVAVSVLMAQNAVVRVPSLAGLDRTSAAARVQETGLVLKVGDRRFSGTVAPGLVVDQSPATGSKVPEGTTVVVALSAGTESFAMPDVIGLPLDQARKRLRDRGLAVDVQTEPSEKPQGTVVSSFPSPGVTVATGDKVRIGVAAGSNAANALLPTNMAGKTFVLDPAPMPAGGGVDAPLDIARRVRALLEASGARVIVTREVTDSGDSASTLNRAKRAREASAAALVGFSVMPAGDAGLSVISVPATRTTEAFFLASNSMATGLVTALRESGKPVTSAPAANDPIVTSTGIAAVRLRLGSTATPADKLTFTDPQWADDIARAVYRVLSSVYGSK
jgi:N-acetylmuramoyl-L-alanine amidase